MTAVGQVLNASLVAVLTDAVLLQGRVACEINSGDELASTELIFGGVLTQLTPEEAVAVLSALVFQASIKTLLTHPCQGTYHIGFCTASC